MISTNLRERKQLPRVPLGAASVSRKMAGAGGGIQVVVQVLRDATWSRRRSRRARSLARASNGMVQMSIELLALRRAACKGKHTATGSMFEGRDVFVAWSSKGGNLKP